MGTTLTTLNLYDAELSAVSSALAPTDILRDQNAPWISIVPAYEDEEAFDRFVKTAKKLTVNSKTAALLFYYFDDDVFKCTLYRNGKKSASCESGKSWAKLGKELSELFGDDLPSKAFRFVSHCFSLEERLALLEETLGTALFDTQEEDARIVERSDATLNVVKSREAMIRKRSNRFVLVEAGREEWPEALRYRQKLLELLRPQWKKYQLYRLLYGVDIHTKIVPGSRSVIALRYTEDWDRPTEKMLLIDGETGSRRELGPFSSGFAGRAVWQTESGDIVLLSVRNVISNAEHPDDPEITQVSYLVSIDKDGSEKWRFEPEINKYQSIQFVHSSEQGIITLFAGGLDSEVKADTYIWQVDAESGTLIRTRSFPYRDEIHHLTYAAPMNAFVCVRRSSDQLVLLSEDLEDIRCIDGYTGSYYIEEEQFCKSKLWARDIWDQRFVDLWDLQDGTHERTALEVPVYTQAVLEDGRILGFNEKQDTLFVFGKDGTLLARCKVPGVLNKVFVSNGAVYAAEIRGPGGALVYGLLFDKMSTQVWRLDPLQD